eukprot:GEMP01015761.1.p1 GENE.GEMP01015761.1~~GEMP01015761.1.p1  ORF type:complete len:509 (+),score=86.54 GEMP01015761.1:452-1978(+)
MTVSSIMPPRHPSPSTHFMESRTHSMQSKTAPSTSLMSNRSPGLLGGTGGFHMDDSMKTMYARTPVMNLCALVEHKSKDFVLSHLRDLVIIDKERKTALRDYTTLRQDITFFAAVRKQSLGGSYEILQFLCKEGFSLNKVDYFAQTPLFYAARECNYDACKLLIREKCDPQLADQNGQTPLFYAVSDTAKRGEIVNRSEREQVILLLAQHDDLNYEDKFEKKAIDLTSDPDLKKLLRKKGTRRPRSSLLPAEDLRPSKIAKTAKTAKSAKMAVKCIEQPVHVHQGISPSGEYWTYQIHPALPQDAVQLAACENEFIDDHQAVLEQLLGETPPLTATCSALGLNPVAQARVGTIRWITSRASKDERTMKVVHVESDEIVGYLYFKCKGYKKRSSRNVNDDDDMCLEISHLKVKNTHTRRGVATALFLGVLKYLNLEKLQKFAEDVRLSVFDANTSAIKLYERLGFEQYSLKTVERVYGDYCNHPLRVAGVFWDKARRKVRVSVFESVMR